MKTRIRYEMGVRVPEPIFLHPREITGEMKDEIWGTCVRRKKGHCINTNLVKAVASALGRRVTHVSTYDGYQHWSEHGAKWCQPLKLTYLERLDLFDTFAANFRLPRTAPYSGPVEFKGLSDSRPQDTREIRESRRTRHTVRKARGEARRYQNKDRPLQYEAALARSRAA